MRGSKHTYLRRFRTPIKSHTNQYGLDIRKVTNLGVVTYYDHHGRVTSTAQSSGQVTSTGSVRYFHSKNRKTTVNGVPDFRPPSMYVRSTYHENHTPGRIVYTRSDGSVAEVHEGLCPWDIGYLGPHIDNGIRIIYDSNQVNRCNVECLNKLPDMKVSLGQNLAESRETIHQVVHTASRVINAFHALHRRDFRGMAKHLGVDFKSLKSGATFSDWWLEYHFGWQPLLADIHGGIEQVKEGFRHKAQVFSVSRTITESSSGPGTIPGPIVYSNIKVTGQSFLSTRVKIYARVSDSTLANISSLGLINPAQVAWELVPYSFVVDWFLPVGSFLEALTDTAGLTFVSGVRTYRVRSSFVSEYTPPSYSWPKWSGSYQATLNLQAMERHPLGGWPLPLPYVKNPLSTIHVASGLALVRQLVANRWRR